MNKTIDLAALTLRIILGLVFIAHGGQKLFGWFGGYGLQATAQFFDSQLHLQPGIFWASLAAAGEFFGGLFVLLGFLTRLSALNLAFIMLVAILSVHLKNGFFADKGGFEYPLALLAMSKTLFILGPGKISLDYKISKGKNAVAALMHKTDAATEKMLSLWPS